MVRKSNFEFSNAVGVVTGASSGIGRWLVRRLASEGMHVIATARREERLRELASHFDGKVLPVAADVTQADDRKRIIESAKQVGDGRLDLLVNNAGVGAIGRFDEADEDRLRRVFEVDFFATTELTRLALPLLDESRMATICNIGSVLGHSAVPLKSEYCAAKFALHGWNDSLRIELSSRGISVLLVSPSTTRSEFFDSLVKTDPMIKNDSLGSWSADRVAKATVHAIRKGRRESILSVGGKSLVLAGRFFPGLMDWILRRRLNASGSHNSV